MAKKKGAIAAKARAKREAASGTTETSATAATAVATGPIVHANGKRVHRGLMNIGNTCFINSIAQCLNVSLPFSDDLLRLASEGLDGMSGSLCTVMRGIRGTDDTAASLQKFSPKAFHTELINKFPWYFGKQQHDAHEFLRTLIGAIADERTIAERDHIQDLADEGKFPDLDAESECGKVVGNSFRGNIFAASLCWSCGGVSARLDPFLDLSLDLPMPSGTSRKPLGVTSTLEFGLPDEFEEEPQEQDTDDAAAAEDGPLIGRWAAKRDVEIIAAFREITPKLIERIVVQVLRRKGTEVKTEPEGSSFEITLIRPSKKATPRWGFRWSEARLKEKVFVVGGIIEDTALDKWNLKRMTTGGASSAIYVGDKLVEVNGEKDFEAMRQKMKYDNELHLHFVHSASKEPHTGGLHDETDDEAEELRAAAAAAKEERRSEFCKQVGVCYEALPASLKSLFGAARTSRTRNGRLELQHCLEQFSMVDVLEDDYQPVYSCASCRSTKGCRTFASRKLWLWPAGLPPMLTIQLKRFRCYAGEFVKSATSVSLPAELDLSDNVLTEAQLESLVAHAAAGSEFAKLTEEMKSNTSASVRYELYALCEHAGTQMQDGHYIAYVNSGPSLEKEEWFGISDVKLWKCTRADVLKVEAYVAFYRRVELKAPEGEPASVDDSKASGDEVA